MSFIKTCEIDQVEGRTKEDAQKIYTICLDEKNKKERYKGYEEASLTFIVMQSYIKMVSNTGRRKIFYIHGNFTPFSGAITFDLDCPDYSSQKQSTNNAHMQWS